MTPDEHYAEADRLLAELHAFYENVQHEDEYAILAARAQAHATLAARPDRGLRTALNLIGTDCSNYTGTTTCVENGRSPYAPYTADRWCNECIARTALSGEPFPPAPRPEETDMTKKDAEFASRKMVQPDEGAEAPAAAIDLMAALKASLAVAKARREARVAMRTRPTKPTA